MELKVWKLYNKWMYLWNTEDLYVDWGELSWDWRNVFLRWDMIYDTRDADILEDNNDMLPRQIIYQHKLYKCIIDTFDMSSYFRLQYTYLNWFSLIDIKWESIYELVEKFNEHKKSTGYPDEIIYIY